MVVDDQHANAHRSGTSATSVVPERSLDSIRIVPPSSAIRSRMPISP